MFEKTKLKIATSIANQLNKNSFGMSGLSKYFSTANLEDQGIFNIDDAYNSNAYVNIAVNKIAKNIVRAKSEIVNSKGDVVDSGPVYNLFRDVNSQMSRAQLWEATVSWLGIRGESIWVLSGNNEGSITRVPVAIHVVDPTYFRQILNKEETEVILWMYEKNEVVIPFTTSEIIHFREWNAVDQWRGVNPLRALSDEIESDRLIDKTNNTLMKNKSVPAGLLTTEESITEQQAKEILSMWNKNHGGHAKSGKTGVLGSGTKYQRIALSSADMEFFQSKKWNRNVITGMYGVPAIVAGFKDDTTSLSGSDTNEQLKFFWEQTLIPIIRFLEDKLDTEFSKRFAPDLHIRFNTTDIPELQEDLVLLATRIREDVKAGLLTQNEGRELMKLDTVEWGNTWWRDSRLIDTTTETVTLEETHSLSIFNDNDIDKDIEEWNYIKHNSEYAETLLSELKDWLYKQRSVVLEQLNIKGGGEINEYFWDQQSSFLRDRTNVIIDDVKKKVIENANLNIDAGFIDYKIGNDNNIIRLSDHIKEWVGDCIESGDIDETREKYKIASAKLSVIAEKEIDALVNHIRSEINGISGKKKADELEDRAIWERDLEREVVDFYEDKFKDIKGKLDDPTTLLILLGTLNYSGELFSKITPTLNNAYAAAADIIFKKQKALFFLAEEKAELYLRDRGLLLKNATDPVVEAISRYVGKPDIALDTLSKDIKSKWGAASLNRARLIAQTETTTAFSAGKEAAMIELGIEYKRWVNAGDDKVRSEHTDEATGVVRKVGQLFKNGMMGPGGIGCRCILSVGEKGDQRI